jgi:hypothetical protein
MTEVLGVAGIDVECSGHLSVIDGGPYLNEMGIEELGSDNGYVRQTTNALLLIPKGTKNKDYADVETDPPKEGIVSLVGELSGVRIPLGGRYLETSEMLVSEGEEVKYEQKLGARGRRVLDRHVGERGGKGLLTRGRHHSHRGRRA